ncbi:hypothetical protein Vadar_033610 [Vaccinium darrowii]|uniref:Uncharacterized protein n=1 Tax=Vaccinium darrowii TaxID=229202 RepID=A0ACB7YTN3_9ERIC|nr:hypothetical protein Vadar_033610 [Vaccinium darrowii]
MTTTCGKECGHDHGKDCECGHDHGCKDCECGHDHGCKVTKIPRWVFIGLLIFCFTVPVIFLITRAILQPTKPQFVLQDATVYALNISAPNFVSTTISLTISSRNSNNNIGIYYDHLDVYATYQDQQITYYTAIPPTYQGGSNVNVWSPYILGSNVPVAPNNGMSLCQEEADGAIKLSIKIHGRMRWKVGIVTTGDYHLYITCPALITFGSHSTGIPVGDAAVKYQLVQSCNVNM